MSPTLATGGLGSLRRTGLRVDLIGGLGTPIFLSCMGETVEGRARDWRRAKDAFKLSSDVNVLRRPRPGVVEAAVGLMGSDISDGEGDIGRAIDDLVGTRRREVLETGGTFSSLIRFLNSKPTTGIRLCLLTLRSPSGVIVKVGRASAAYLKPGSGSMRTIREKALGFFVVLQQISVL
jgi:hypothetical protein